MGGMTSFLTTWLTQQTALREKHREAETANRQELFNDFIVEASRLFGDALSHEKDDVSDMVQLYALVGKIRLWASRPVVTAAEHAMQSIVQTYLEPNRSLHEIRTLAMDGRMNFLLEFGEACRADLDGSAKHHRVKTKT